MKNLKYRMYGLVPYNISPIQQGIQFGHGVVEYINNNIHRVYKDIRLPLEKWMQEDKTFIILNGGTTNLNGSGTLNKHLDTLEYNEIPYSTFYEPDLGDQLTSVNFLVDERVWDKENYPDYEDSHFFNESITSETYDKWLEFVGGEKNVFLRTFLKQFRLA